MFRKLTDCVVSNKNVFVRGDMNVSFKNGKIIDDTRIRAVIPTVKYLVENKAKVILTTHLGRPDGQRKEEYSLKHILDRVRELLPGVKVNFSEDCVGEQTRKDVESTNYGEVILLENLRYHPEEEANDENFAKELASLANLYVNDAFSCCHRKHASMVGVPAILKACPGFSLQEELDNLTRLVSEPERPTMVIVGGAKVSDKLGLLKALVKKTDYVVVGGGMANTFLYALGHNVGKSLMEADLKDEVLSLLDEAKKNNCEVILPDDVVVSKEVAENQNVETVDIDNVKADDIIVDLGKKSIDKIANRLEKCKNVIWNGPVGIYEIKPFDTGTNELAKVIASMTKAKKLTSVAGGGDILSALNATGTSEDFTYISTAGGAFLKWLEKGILVAVECLKEDK